MKTTTRDSGAVSKALGKLEAFTTSGALRGQVATGWVETGKLPDPWLSDLRLEMRRVDYVVFSYSTPIAWHTQFGWTVPDVRYSRTTNKHQSTVLTALDQLGDFEMNRKQEAAARSRIKAELDWMREHGSSRAGYVLRYGSASDPDHYGDGGEAIYAADLAALQAAQQQLILAGGAR